MLKRKFLTRSVVVAALIALTTGGTALTSAAGEATSPRDAGTLESTAGCGQEPTLTDGTHTVPSGRSFILDVPDNYDNSRPYRLVFGLHWWGGTAEDVATGQTVETGTWAYYGLQRLSDNSTIFVAPQGTDDGWANPGGEDVVFIDDIIAMLDADLCIDTTQRFSIGFSYGGAMSISLACSRPDVFRAVVAQSSPGEISGCDGGTEPVAYMGVHGISDNFTGGEAQRDRWVTNNGCTPQDTPEPAAGSLTHVTTAYEGCSEGHPVVWAAFDEGHIAAPQDGAPGDSASSWVPGEAWDFITQFESTASPE
jgi:poly(3-hydroxybutyrate) depolymerase